MYEQEMVEKVYNHLKDEGKSVVLEVPFMQQSIDLVYEDGEKLVAIEFKLKNWKRALEQANSHFLGTDEVYICIPKPKKGTTQVLLDAIQKTHIGLMFYDETYESFVEVIKPACYEKEIWQVGSMWLKEAFNNRLQGIWA